MDNKALAKVFTLRNKEDAHEIEAGSFVVDFLKNDPQSWTFSLKETTGPAEWWKNEVVVTNYKVFPYRQELEDQGAFFVPCRARGAQAGRDDFREMVRDLLQLPPLTDEEQAMVALYAEAMAQIDTRHDLQREAKKAYDKSRGAKRQAATERLGQLSRLERKLWARAHRRGARFAVLLLARMGAPEHINDTCRARAGEDFTERTLARFAAPVAPAPEPAPEPEQWTSADDPAWAERIPFGGTKALPWIVEQHEAGRITTGDVLELCEGRPEWLAEAAEEAAALLDIVTPAQIEAERWDAEQEAATPQRAAVAQLRFSF